MSHISQSRLSRSGLALPKDGGHGASIGAESRALIEALLMLLSVLMAVFMEKNTRKSSTKLHLALARWEQMAIDRILIQPAMHVDETSIRVEKHNHWIHGSAGINRHRVEDERASH